MHMHPLPSSLNTHHTSSFKFQQLQSWMFFHWVSVLRSFKTLFTQNDRITLISDGMILIFVVCFQAIALGIITKLACFGTLASFFSPTVCYLLLSAPSSSIFYSVFWSFSYIFVFLPRAEGCFLTDFFAQKSLRCLDYLRALTHELEKQRERSLARSMRPRIYQLPCSCSGFLLLCPRASVDV